MNENSQANAGKGNGGPSESERMLQMHNDVDVIILNKPCPIMIQGAVVAPHGDEILIPESADLKKLHTAMRIAAEKLKNADELIIVSPHNIRIDTHIGIILTENLSGTWKWKRIKIEKTLKCNRSLANELYSECMKNKLPVVGINFGALEGPLSTMPLDWGSLIPLYFFEDRPTMLITPARKIARGDLVKFGELLGTLCHYSPHNFGIIISADQAHTHSDEGPYGFNPDAKEYDSKINKILKSGNLDDLLLINEDLIGNAMPDSYWQLLILAGIMHVVPMKNTLLEYAVANYFGMSVAVFEP